MIAPQVSARTMELVLIRKEAMSAHAQKDSMVRTAI